MQIYPFSEVPLCFLVTPKKDLFLNLVGCAKVILFEILGSLEETQNSRVQVLQVIREAHPNVL